MRSNVRGWFTTLAVLALLVAGMSVRVAVERAGGVERSPAAQAGAIHVFPVPGTTTVSPGTQISFRGSGIGTLSDLKVVGSSSGAHSGHWLAHSDGNGRSFMPDKPFTAGETVTVSTAANIAGATGGSFTYQVAQPAPITPSQAAALYPETNSSAATAPQATSPRSSTLQAAPNATTAATAPPTPSGNVGPFRSRPDLNAPKIATTSSGTHAPGLVFTTSLAGVPNGAEIYDDTGQPIWLQPAMTPSYLHPITYRGQPALTYYYAISGSAGASQGEWIVLDTSYREIARIRTGNGYAADLHELQISPDGTKAVMDIYNFVRMDMSAYGGPVDATVTDGVIQEIDIATGAVTFEWHSLTPGNIPVTDSYENLSAPTVDYMHLNSIAYDTDGNFLFSGRQTSQVGKIDRATGAVMWIMGGKRNQFTFTDGDGGPSWPHDVRRRPDGTISVFDNGVGRNPPYSRAVSWQVDETAKTAHVVQLLRETPDLYADITGNNTTLPNGDDFVSWGNTGRVIEYQGQTQVWESQMAVGGFPYRTVRAEWHATPARPPDMAIDRGVGGVAAYISWNGATDVASWQLWGGPDWSHLRQLASVPRSGFETPMLVPTQPTDGVFQARAIDASGNTLGISGNVADPITAKYLALGGSVSFLGAPTGGGEYAAGSGLAEDFAGGTIYWSAATGAHEVHGDIGDHYKALGGPTGFLGFPTSDETAVSDGRGRFNSFQGGAIYWTSTTGAHEVHGAFGFVWSILGGTKSVLGYPATDLQTAADGVGQDQWFETGAIYSSPSTGIFEVHGGDVLVWASMGAEHGSFGYPISNTVTASDGSQVTFFQHGWIQYFPSDGHVASGFY